MGGLATHPRLLALLVGALAATGFAPLHWWPLTLASFALLLWLLEQPAPNPKSHPLRHAFTLGWLFGVGHFTVGNNWIAHAFTFQDAMPHWLGIFAVLALSLYLAVYPGLAALGLVWARSRWPALPAVPLFAALWLLTEMGRATIFTGFAWNPLGVIWLDTGIEHAATLIGTYGLGALAVLAAGSLLALARRHWLAAGSALFPVLLAAALGQWTSPAPRAATGTAITVVQPNIGQDEKYEEQAEERHFAKLGGLTGTPSTRPRLIFWPEAAIPAWLDMEPEWRHRVAGLLGPHDLLMTGGAKVYFKEKRKGFYADRTLIGANNSAWVLTPDARLIARYDKAHLVPYGEYLPMRALLQPLGLSRLVPGDADFWPGPGPRSLLLPGVAGRPSLKMGVQICYEIIFSGEVVHRANRPDFLYNPSNDAWFGDWGPPQHLAQARLRAVEEAMPIIRSTPTGISAVIDARGRLLAGIPLHRPGAINGALPPAAPPTLFAQLGNLLPLLLALSLVGFAIVSARRSR
ncbi:apolipoprotein N-acyltransferase [Sphingobium subterraneum]|uniref:Apolipoprotein N-acyltransferase n=1 Tax=Sphingobium subterraneum TaxID=627688 RepID=A0A841J2F0_9SPHN|nr:apolipoprotein N-acyltransferase [Sphingobium subterraneum]MBB6125133.1 apolipoprotein N-acyltransferase [Sphingobium subterraneum]